MRRLFNRKILQIIAFLFLVYTYIWVRENLELAGSADDDNIFPKIVRRSDSQSPGCKCPSSQHHEGADGDKAEYKNIIMGDDKPRYSQFSTKMFVEGHTKMVLILAYQRVGSSFFGKILDRNPSVFYVYEPLDALYSALYGTGSGFNVPSDITSFKNGSNRIIPQEEKDEISAFLEDLMSCDLDNLPTEFFVQRYWSLLAGFMPSWEPYLQCLKEQNITSGRDKCAKRLHCPKRFGMQPWNSLQCKSKLRMSSSEAPDQFNSFKKCMDSIRQKAQKCIKIMRSKCESAPFRATKTVRATMESVEGLIKSNPNLRVIHLFRDPLPVVSSRMKTDTYHGLFSRNSSAKESKLYCNIVTRDLQLRKQLEVKHPGVFFEVIYEDFIKQPVEYTQSVYEFLDLEMPPSILPWIRNETRGSPENPKRKIMLTPKWKRFITVDEKEHVMKNCETFYDMVKYDFS